jgi:aryl-alcohol dehydrogenase-like predicted oxidoreductase
MTAAAAVGLFETILSCVTVPTVPAGYMERYNKSQARTATEEYVQVAQKHGLTPTQLALAWCRCAWDILCTGRRVAHVTYYVTYHVT